MLIIKKAYVNISKSILHVEKILLSGLISIFLWVSVPSHKYYPMCSNRLCVKYFSKC